MTCTWDGWNEGRIYIDGCRSTFLIVFMVGEASRASHSVIGRLAVEALAYHSTASTA